MPTPWQVRCYLLSNQRAMPIKALALAVILLLSAPATAAAFAPAAAATAANATAATIVQHATPLVIASALAYLGLEAADYLLDPANNSVIVKRPYNTDIGVLPAAPDNPAMSISDAPVKPISSDVMCSGYGMQFNQYDALYKLKSYWKDWQKDTGTYTSCAYINGGQALRCHWSYYDDRSPSYEDHPCSPIDAIQSPDATSPIKDTIAVPIDDVAAAISALAAQGNKAAQRVIDAANAASPAAPNDKPLAPAIPNAASPAKPQTIPQAPPTLTLPDFCTWASFVCGADNSPQTPSRVDISPEAVQPPSTFDKSYLTFAHQCPVFPMHTLVLGPTKVNLSFDMTPLCRFAEQVRPAILALAYLSALYIVANAIRG